MILSPKKHQNQSESVGGEQSEEDIPGKEAGDGDEDEDIEVRPRRKKREFLFSASFRNCSGGSVAQASP